MRLLMDPIELPINVNWKRPINDHQFTNQIKTRKRKQKTAVAINFI